MPVKSVMPLFAQYIANAVMTSWQLVSNKLPLKQRLYPWFCNQVLNAGSGMFTYCDFTWMGPIHPRKKITQKNFPILTFTSIAWILKTKEIAYWQSDHSVNITIGWVK